MSFEKWIFVHFSIPKLPDIITSITNLLDGLLDFSQKPPAILQYHNFKCKLSKDAESS